jgi:gliding motility-associated protein GldM
MAGYKETPRQKMISMMYLVLYALLALNVSKQVLDAFLVVNESMVSTNESMSAKIATTYNRFEEQYALQKEKVGPFWEKAKIVKSESDQILKYLKHLKLKLVEVTDDKDSAFVMQHYYYDSLVPDPYHPGSMVQTKFLDLEKVPSKDKYNDPTDYLIGNETRKNGEAYRLSKLMGNFRAQIVKVMDLSDTTSKVGLITNYIGDKKIIYRNADGQKQDWENHNFYYTILAADITLINKIISDVKGAEFDAMNYLFSSVTEKDFKFDHIEAKIIPKSTYVLEGNHYEAEVLVAAYDSKTNPKVWVLSGADSITSRNIRRATLIHGKGGTVKLDFPATSAGTHKYAGTIEMVNPATNSVAKYNFNGSYIVAPPSLTVAPLKMNVIYIGLNNPVSITSPGIPDEKIHPSITAGTLTKNGRTWEVMIKKQVPDNQVYISATADINGKQVSLGKSLFRVKRVPDPVAQIAGQTNGTIDRNTFLAAGAIIPNMKDFEFDVYFTVSSYTFATLINGDWIPKNITGNRFTNEIDDLIRNARPHQKFFFENIVAKGPDGSIRTLNPITLEIQ